MASGVLSSLLIAAAVGIASGAIGSFVLLRRMALVGDALSHVALPGIAIALVLRTDPFWGVLIPLVLAALLIWWLGGRTRLPSDAIVGLLFTASLAIGVLTIPDTEIIESLFGGFPALSVSSLAGVVAAAGVLGALSFRFASPFLFLVVEPDLARTRGVGRKHDLLMLLIFALVVALGIKLVGTLLMGALTIIPAAIGRNVCGSMRAYMVLSAGVGGAISVAGVGIARISGALPGPAIILLGVGIFALTIAAKAGLRNGS